MNNYIDNLFGRALELNLTEIKTLSIMNNKYVPGVYNSLLISHNNIESSIMLLNNDSKVIMINPIISDYYCDEGYFDINKMLINTNNYFSLLTVKTINNKSNGYHDKISITHTDKLESAFDNISRNIYKIIDNQNKSNENINELYDDVDNVKEKISNVENYKSWDAYKTVDNRLTNLDETFKECQTIVSNAIEIKNVAEEKFGLTSTALKYVNDDYKRVKNNFINLLKEKIQNKFN